MIENCGCKFINCTVNTMCDKGLIIIDPVFIFISNNIIYIFAFLMIVMFIGFYNFKKLYKIDELEREEK